MKYIFGKKFKFEEYPTLDDCHKKLIALSDKSYEYEGKYESGECKKADLIKVLDDEREFVTTTYAKAVYDCFSNKDLILMNRGTKQKQSFDMLFPDFEKLDPVQRKSLVNIVENAWGWKLPAEYYDKHKNL